MEITWLTDQIAVGGGIWNADNMSKLARAGITHIIDMQIEFDDRDLVPPHNPAGPNIQVLWNPTDNDFQPKPASLLRIGVEFAESGERTVRFWYKDKKLGRRVYVQCSLEKFIDLWAQHIPECYEHAVRSFGLFAPQALSQTSAAIFAILGQERKPRPKPRRWADSIKRDFGRDPLLDHTGKRMKWSRRLRAKATP